MVTKIMQSIRIFCGNHGDDFTIEMTPHEGAEGMDMFYSCPKYYPENRTGNERPCGNRISLNEYNNMVDYLSGLIEKADMEYQSLNLTGHKWVSKRGVAYMVIKHSMKHLDILVYNKAALRA